MLSLANDEKLFLTVEGYLLAISACNDNEKVEEMTGDEKYNCTTQGTTKLIRKMTNIYN